MKISIESKDIVNYLDLEMYIKERNYLINHQEYLLLHKKALELQAKTLKYEKGKRDFYGSAVIDGIAVFVFEDKNKKEFHCWTNVLEISEEEERKRMLSIAIEEVSSIYDLYRYVEERNFLLSGIEEGFVQDKARELKVSSIKLDTNVQGSSNETLKNQTIAIHHYEWDNGFRFSIHLMPYHPTRLERKK